MHGSIFIGFTVTTNADIKRLAEVQSYFMDNQFINVEPILEPLTQESIEFMATAPAVIIGCETGNRKGKADLQTSTQWITNVILKLRNETKIFVKEPVLSELIEYHGYDCPENIRELLWKTRKAVS